MLWVNVLIVCVTVLFFILLLGLLFIQKPDVVDGHFNIYSSNMPRMMLVKVDGEIVFLKTDKDTVARKTDIAYIRTLGDYNQIKELERIVSIDDVYDVRAALLKQNFNMLGELSTNYYDFIRSFEVMENKENDDVHIYDKIQSELLESSYFYSYEMQKQNLELEKEHLKIAEQAYADDSLLYYNDAITKVAFNNSKTNYLTQRQQVEQSYNQLTQLAYKIKDAQTNNTKIGAQHKNEVVNDKSAAYYYLHTLRASIKEWKNKYVLTAPCNGRVEYSLYIEDGQLINGGTEVARVLPLGKEVKAIVYFPTKNSSDVHSGAPVKLFLDNYDQYSYGYIDAMIAKKSSSVSTSSDGSTFCTAELFINLTNQKHFNDKLFFDEGMSGRASVIVKEKSLLQKIFTWITIMTT